ncbi:MAG: PQQ-binding-like beta-propeller repeat protein [Candidatus Acidiferrales bacterium]
MTPGFIKRLVRGGVFAVVLLGAVVLIAAMVSPPIAWRVRLLRHKLSGQIPEIPWPLFIKWIRPKSPVDLRHLADEPNVNASVTNVLADASSNKARDAAAAGERPYARTCAPCHGDDARGRAGPNLIAAIVNMTDWKFFSTVKFGRAGTLMKAQPLSDVEIWQVCSLLRQSALDAAVGKKGLHAQSSSYAPVSAEALRSAGQSGDWITYAGNYAGYRHGAQDQINRDNVHLLRLAWASQLPSDGGFQESSPIVVGNRMFVTEPREGVTALNAETGAMLWQFDRPVPTNLPPPCCGMPNKGVGVLGKNVYVETFDSHLLALDAVTGAKIWDVAIAEPYKAYSMTSAPLVIDDRVIVGIAGGDMGIRGFLAAYSAADGSELWRFDTVAGPGQPGHETWTGDTWMHGGAATWNTGAYDPDLGLVYWGTGNPGPAFNSQKRPGKNLYTESVVAVDVKTGKLRWYYQFTPSDDHGWDATQQPVLADIKWHGETTPALFLANRNAFFYGLDRRNGKFLFATPYARQSWASGFTPDGDPIVLSTSHPTRGGSVVSPASNGATNWWAPSFDPTRNLMFIPCADTTDTYFNTDETEYHEGRTFLGSGYQRAHTQPTTLALRAIDVTTGQMRWDSTLETGGAEVPGEMGGVLSTEGDLVFAGFDNEFHAFDADTGASLWKMPLGGIVHAAPISYMIAGHQYIAVFAGRTLFVFGLPSDNPGGATHLPQVGSRASRVRAN